ncbi:hypothetical protein [Streptomyces pactum]|uniref:Uncharacterized protein n=1 Tax=Streptomyces pactum TaxID=68249 RepID=A0A1S6JGE5_9ACTN|nr:hypothetical protein [Streptomyces pactum]AQS70831.1 hypothetical protein B1H29_31595 [Streptomyces pactum]
MHRTGPPAATAEAPAPLDVPPAIVRVLGLPPLLLAKVTVDQARGAVCVWGTERLTGETAVDLGEPLDTAGRWFPRACRRHVADRAHRALLVHAPGCGDCRKRPAPSETAACETARALYRLVRDGRR